MNKKNALKKYNEEFFIESAKNHGQDSEPDHEVGDLQDYFRRAWALMTPDQKWAFLQDEKVQDTFYGASGEELALAQKNKDEYWPL